MVLSELKTGMHVVLRNGTEMIVMKGTKDEDGLVDLHGATLDNGTWCDLSLYDEDMTHQSFFENDSMSQFDIIRVYDIPIGDSAMLVDIKDNHDYDDKIIYIEKTITRTEAEKKLGVKIVD